MVVYLYITGPKHHPHLLIVTPTLPDATVYLHDIKHLDILLDITINNFYFTIYNYDQGKKKYKSIYRILTIG